jgi:DNA repair exonuclease SbcCD ATPase subunit
MARTRALVTDTEAEYIAYNTDATANQRYQAIARVRDRLDALERDIETLETHHPGLLAEIREVACLDSASTTASERIAHLEAENERLHEALTAAETTDRDVNVQGAINAIETAQARGDRMDVKEAMNRALETLHRLTLNPA